MKADFVSHEMVCKLCEGSGEIVVSAHQQGGEIVDEVRRPCPCQLRDDELTEDDFLQN